MPLESQFSVQVTQPYLNQPFPIRPVEPIDDRLFRHITFFEDDADITLRLSAVNHNYKTVLSTVQKKVQTNLLVNDIHQEVFRVKAVLSESEHGIDSSHWVTQKNMDSDYVSTHNQYRIRGISSESWKGDWIYSELRDSDNDLIVYNMLYDVLELLTTVHDDQLDYLMDYIVSDTFIKIITERAPELITSLDPADSKTTAISELMKFMSSKVSTSPQEDMATQLGESFLLLSDELKKDFKENVMSTPKEFANLYQVYKFFDRYQEKKQDALSLLIEIFLEDRLEKLVQKTDIEVLLQNDEETGIYLNGVYDFDIQSELITSTYDASPNDSFVTKFDDAVQLLSQPVFSESLAYDTDETVAKFLRMVLFEVYAPLAAIDVRLVELEHELEDQLSSETIDSLVEFSTDVDGEVTRHALLFDIIETLIKGDVDISDDYQIVIMDHVLKTMNDPRKTLFIDYNFGEFIEVFLNIGESFRKEYQTISNQVNEQQVARLVEDYRSDAKTSSKSLLESYQATIQDTYHLAKAKDLKDITESTYVGLLDVLLTRYKAFKERVDENIQALVQDDILHQSTGANKDQQDSVSVSHLDEALIKDIRNYLRTHEDVQIQAIDETDHKDTTSYLVKQESEVLASEDMYHVLFNHHLRDLSFYRTLDERQIALSHEMNDKFFIDGTDRVRYALGGMGEDWPLGVFRLGTNTLKGEVSNS